MNWVHIDQPPLAMPRADDLAPFETLWNSLHLPTRWPATLPVQSVSTYFFRLQREETFSPCLGRHERPSRDPQN